MKIEDEIFYGIIMGFHIMAMVHARFSREESRKSWDTLEMLLAEYEAEDALAIYDLFMGNNPELEEYMREEIKKAKLMLD
ncbi:hypothetical protein [Anaerotignum sp.]